MALSAPPLIVWEGGSFDIEKSQYKLMAWMAYVLLTLCGDVALMNFLLAVVNQTCEACMQRTQSQSLRAQVLTIRDNYLTLPEGPSDDSSTIVIFEQ